MVDAYLSLNRTVLKNTEKEANEKAIQDSGEGTSDDLEYSDLKFDIGECYFDKDKETLVLNGNLIYNNKELGYFSSYEIPIDLDVVVELVQAYMKKLGKLKTILEATK